MMSPMGADASISNVAGRSEKRLYDGEMMENDVVTLC